MCVDLTTFSYSRIERPEAQTLTEAITADRLGAELTALTRLDLGSITAVYRASLANRLVCFLKVAPWCAASPSLRSASVRWQQSCAASGA